MSGPVFNISSMAWQGGWPVMPDGSRDGQGAGDHDEPFVFGHPPRAVWPYPFTMLQYAHLLLLRSMVRDGELKGDTGE